MNDSNQLKPWWYRLGKAFSSLPWARIGLIVLCAVLAFVLTALITGTVYIENLLGQIRRPSMDNNQPQPNPPSSDILDNIEVPDDIIPDVPTAKPQTIIAHEDIVNIMLVGQDRRGGENYLTRSDAMILCTINKRNKTITLTSFMRDTYVEIPGYKGYKMNAAYQWGGMSLLRKTMLENFGVQVDAFVEVDFSGFTQVVDAIGGVEITLNQAEAAHLNELHGYSLVVGVNRLNGDQALQYSRIRYVGGDDFERTERQRKVLNAIISNCKNLNFTQINNLLNNILPLVATDMDNNQILNYMVDLFPILASSSISQQRIPIEGYEAIKKTESGDEFIVPNMELNRQFLIDTLMPK